MSEARDRLDQPRETRRSLRRRRRDEDRFGVFAERFARFMGTARFLLWMTVFVSFWLVWNYVAPARWQFDEYPYMYLTLILSLQASYAAPLILLAQNRQEQRDKVLAEQDRRANARGHADMEFLAREVASLRMTTGDMATRDFIRSELRGLREDLRERDEEREQERDPDRARAAEEPRSPEGDQPES